MYTLMTTFPTPPQNHIILGELEQCSTIISKIFFQPTDTHSASFDDKAFF